MNRKLLALALVTAVFAGANSSALAFGFGCPCWKPWELYQFAPKNAAEPEAECFGKDSNTDSGFSSFSQNTIGDLATLSGFIGMVSYSGDSSVGSGTCSLTVSDNAEIVEFRIEELSDKKQLQACVTSLNVFCALKRRQIRLSAP